MVYMDLWRPVGETKQPLISIISILKIHNNGYSSHQADLHDFNQIIHHSPYGPDRNTHA